MRSALYLGLTLVLLLTGVACGIGGTVGAGVETPTPEPTPVRLAIPGPVLEPCEEQPHPPGFPIIDTCWRAAEGMTVDGVTLGPTMGPQGPTVNQDEIRLLEDFAEEFGGLALWEAVSRYNDGATIAREVTDRLAASLAALPPTPTPTPDAQAAALLAQSRAAMAEVRSYRYELIIAEEQEPRRLFPPHERTGAWVAPDRWLLTVDGVDIQIIVGDRAWARRGGDGPDTPWHLSLAVPLFPPYPAPDLPFQHMTDPFLLGEETLDGVPVYRLSGRYRADLAMGFESTREIEPNHLELFIRRSDHLPMRLVILDAVRGVSATQPGATPQPRPTRPEDAWIYKYHSFNEPIAIEPPERWETGPMPTATPGQAFRSSIGFQPEPRELTDAQWAELAAAVRDLLRDAGHHEASVRVRDGLLIVDAPYTREDAAQLIRLVREAPLPFPLTMHGEAYGWSGSPAR